MPDFSYGGIPLPLDGTTYDVRLRNKHGDDRRFHLSIATEDPLRISLEGTNELWVTVPADTTQLQRVYVTASGDSETAKAERTEFRFWVEDLDSTDRASKDTVFSGDAAK